MDETLREMADAIGLDYAGGLTGDRADAIPEPEALLDRAGDWTFTWSDAVTGEQIRMKVESPAVHGSDLWAFLTVRLRRPSVRGAVTLLSRKRWNLRSTSQTESHSRALCRRLDRDWDGRLTQVAAHIEASYHFGDPGVWLDDLASPGPVTYLVDRLIERGQHTVIAADGGSLKSMVASAVAVSLGTGETLLPGLSVNTHCRTLYLDYETDQSVHKRRYDRLLAGLSTRNDTSQNVPARSVMYKRLYAPLADASDEIRRLIAAHGFELVIIDSASRAVGGETVDERMVIPYFNAASSWGVTVLTIAHKAKDPASKGPAGAAQWRNQARSYWEVEKDQAEGDDTARIALRHLKSNNGRLSRPIGFRVVFTGDAVRFKRADAAESMAIREKLSPLDRVTADLRESPDSTVREISERTGLSIGHAGNVLRMSEGKRFRGSDDRYNRKWSLLRRER